MTTIPRRSVVITGSEGMIGSILQEGLLPYHQLLCIDKNVIIKGKVSLDLERELDKLSVIIRNYHVVIHLAWDMREDYPRETILPENKVMAENVFKAAVRSQVSRVIMASSVHADSYSDSKPGDSIKPTRNRFPDSPYGASKLYIENLGHYYANRYGLEVICIRFGGVNLQNQVRHNEDPLYDRVLLYHEDCVDLVNRCIVAKAVPSHYAVICAVSNNKNRVHSLDNFLNWKPRFPK